MPVLYGVLSEKDLADQRVDDSNVEIVQDAINQSAAEHTRQMDAILGLFVMPTTQYKTKFWSSVAARLQPLDASGRALPIKPGGTYDLAYPIQMAGAAWGTDYVTSVKMRIGEVARITSMMLSADMRWMRDHALAALFFKDTTNPWTFVDPAHGSLSIYGLANGDTVTYQIATGADSGATDDHLKAASTLTASVFEDIKNELTEHPENAGQVIVFIPTALKSTAEGLTGFIAVADPNVNPASTAATLIRSLSTPIPGEIIGYIEGCWVAEWRSLPSTHIIGVTTEGEKPLALREDEEEQLRGFKKVADRDNHPWYEQQWLRRGGFAAWNRVGAVVYYIGDTTYAVPTGYTSPMP